MVRTHQSPRARRGIVFIIALVALLVMLLVGLTFVRQASQQLRMARNDLNTLHALAMADGGVYYMRWPQKYSGTPGNGVNLSFSTSGIPTPTQAGIAETRLGFASLDRVTDFNAAHTAHLPNLDDDGVDQGTVWIFKQDLMGATDDAGNVLTGYQVLSKGYYRGHEVAVRAPLTPPPKQITAPESGGDDEPPPHPPSRRFTTMPCSATPASPSAVGRLSTETSARTDSSTSAGIAR